MDKVGKPLDDETLTIRTRVVHCKKSQYDVYVGRPSKWGNPFKIGVDGTREEVIEKYKIWISTNDELLNSVHELYGKTLGCWCKPHACHGDVLAQMAEHAGVGQSPGFTL